jgi:serine/threonine protein kinase
MTTPLTIVTRFIPNGVLSNALHRDHVPLFGTQKTNIAMGITSRVVCLHEENAIHRDLKSGNVLLDRQYKPVICDFGLSRFLNLLEDSPTMSRVGTPACTAPEMMISSTYTNKVDVYNYGIILNEILSGVMPFMRMKLMEGLTALLKRNERPPIPDGAPPALRKLIRCCSELVPEKRPSFDRVFHIFASHRAAFPGTRENEIDDYARFLLQWCQEKGRKSRRRAKQTKQPGLTADSIRDTLVQLDRVAAVKLISKVGKAEFKMFYEAVLEFIKSDDEDVVHSDVFGLLFLLQENSECLELFAQLFDPSKFPLGDTKF